MLLLRRLMESLGSAGTVVVVVVSVLRFHRAASPEPEHQAPFDVRYTVRGR